MAKKEEFYKQCTFESGEAITTAWIEEKGAKVGHSMVFKDSDEPDRRWTVLTVGDSRITAEVANKRQREYLKLKEVIKT